MTRPCGGIKAELQVKFPAGAIKVSWLKGIAPKGDLQGACRPVDRFET